MSLTNLLRNAALGIALTLGCAPSENKFDRSFDNAREQMERQGIEVRGGLWNDEEQFARLVDYMREDLGDSQSAVSRRYGSNSCDEVGLSGYRESVFYCGPGAVQGDCERVNPGNCLNQICYEHDGCYDDLLDEKNQICLWGDQTEDCDGTFFREYGRCVENDECGFPCRLIGAIAVNLAAIEQTYDFVGPGCLWDGNYDQPRVRDEPKEKKPEYEDSRDKKDPKKEEKPKEKEIDWELRRLCGDFVDRMIYCDVKYLPPQLEQLLGGDGCISENEILKRNRSLFGCVYETTCNEFRDCVGRY